MADREEPVDCGQCWACFDRSGVDPIGYVLCPRCGNKRCSHAANHTLECTGSNAPGQLGATRYPARATAFEVVDSARFKKAVVAMAEQERIHPRAPLDSLLFAAWPALDLEPSPDVDTVDDLAAALADEWVAASPEGEAAANPSPSFEVFQRLATVALRWHTVQGVPGEQGLSAAEPRDDIGASPGASEAPVPADGGRHFTAGVASGRLSVHPNENRTGWLLTASDSGRSGIGNLSAGEAVILAAALRVRDDAAASPFRSRGITHQIDFQPGPDRGWQVSVRSFGGLGTVMIGEADAAQLASLMDLGPGDIVYACAEHKTLAEPCLDCLL